MVARPIVKSGTVQCTIWTFKTATNQNLKKRKTSQLPVIKVLEISTAGICSFLKKVYLRRRKLVRFVDATRDDGNNKKIQTNPLSH